MARRREQKINEEIDRNMKIAFDKLTQEPLPDRLLQLVERLRKESAKSPDDSTPEQPSVPPSLKDT
ncbi:NepR family anti-sigma factor [Marivita sp. S0852]|uniref:NepR family anti-sigma factor n=1 Tax=Marivita sp. S0852 TaxID=3373893 RepID=UPI003982D1AF